MSRFWIIGSFLTLLVAFCIGAQNLVHVNGRSGDVVLQQKTAVEAPSSLYLYYSNGAKADKEHQLKESEIADLISFLVGGPNVDPKATRKQFPSLTAFNKAKANLMFVIPGFTQEQLSHPMMKFLGQKDLLSKYSVESEFYPEDLVARLTTMNTGKSPAEHEIIARTWNTAYFGKTNAFKANALPQVQSVAAALAAAYEGKPIVFSASSDFAFASAFGVYPLDHHSSSHFTYFYNNENSRIENVVDGSVLFSKDDLIERIATRLWKTKEVDETRFLPSRRELIVNIKGTRPVYNEPINGDDVKSIFNLNDKIDLWMFGEFEVAFTLLEKLKSDQELKALVKDHVQDLFSFVFSGVKAVFDKYGAGSSHRLAACYLVDAVMTQIQEELSALYGNQLATELLLVQQPAASQLHNDLVLKQQVFKAVKTLVKSEEQFNEFFPMIYGKDEASAQQLCSALSSFKTAVDVHCYSRDHQTFARLQEEYQQALTLTSNDVSTFQIVLWFSIVIVIAVVVVVYSICYMDAQLDFTLNKAPGSGGMKPHSQ